MPCPFRAAGCFYSVTQGDGASAFALGCYASAFQAVKKGAVTSESGLKLNFRRQEFPAGQSRAARVRLRETSV